jgi:hypothetical protein
VGKSCRTSSTSGGPRAPGGGFKHAVADMCGYSTRSRCDKLRGGPCTVILVA